MSLNNCTSLLVLVAFLLLIVVQNSSCTGNYAYSRTCPFSTQHSSDTPKIPDGLGVNIHFTTPLPGEIKLIAAAGFRWVRMDFKWDETELLPGKYDFSTYDHLLAALDAQKIRALFILDYGNPLYDRGAPPRTEAARTAFARWAVAAANHFQHRGIVWELYNEPNHPMFWPPSPKAGEYIELAAAVGTAFRAEVPREILVGPAVSEIDFAFLNACIKSDVLQYFSAVSVHPYLRSDPEAVAADYCRLRQMIPFRTRQGNTTIPGRIFNSVKDQPSFQAEMSIISSEWGYSSGWRGVNEDKQAELFVRQSLTNLSNGVPISIWYDWREDGADPSEPEHHFGLVRNAYHADRDPVLDVKPAYHAAEALTSFFSGFQFERRINLANETDYVLVFRKESETRLAVWTTGSPHVAGFSTSDGEYSVTDFMAHKLASVKSQSGTLALTISNKPLYVELAYP